MKGKKLTALGLAAMMGMSLLTGCSGGSAETGKMSLDVTYSIHLK